MLRNRNKIFLFLICNFLTASADETTEGYEYYDEDTTTASGFDVLPDIVWRDAVNIDSERYKPAVRELQYFNDQNSLEMKRDRYSNADRCYEDQMRCIVNQVYASPVCACHVCSPPSAISWHSWEEFSTVFPTLCDMFFDNCRRRTRYWRILNYGYCLPPKNEWGGGDLESAIPGYGKQL